MSVLTNFSHLIVSKSNKRTGKKAGPFNFNILCIKKNKCLNIKTTVISWN